MDKELSSSLVCQGNDMGAKQKNPGVSKHVAGIKVEPGNSMPHYLQSSQDQQDWNFKEEPGRSIPHYMQSSQDQQDWNFKDNPGRSMPHCMQSWQDQQDWNFQDNPGRSMPHCMQSWQDQLGRNFKEEPGRSMPHYMQLSQEHQDCNFQDKLGRFMPHCMQAWQDQLDWNLKSGTVRSTKLLPADRVVLCCDPELPRVQYQPETVSPNLDVTRMGKSVSNTVDYKYGFKGDRLVARKMTDFMKVTKIPDRKRGSKLQNIAGSKLQNIAESSRQFTDSLKCKKPKLNTTLSVSTIHEKEESYDFISSSGVDHFNPSHNILLEVKQEIGLEQRRTIFNFHNVISVRNNDLSPLDNETHISTLAFAFLSIEQRLCEKLKSLQFGSKVYCVYNPLEYAFNTHLNYVSKFCNSEKVVLFLGMNPGPYGMAQNGVPFGDVTIVRDWLMIQGDIYKPHKEHPKRPILGLHCSRREVSGSRFWEYFKKKCVIPEIFFKHCFVHNICPLTFMSESGKNITPPELPVIERNLLNDYCASVLVETIRLLHVKILVCIGRFTEQKARKVLSSAGVHDVRIEMIMHPSPANPAANRDWEASVEKQLTDMEVMQYLLDT